MNKNKEIVQNMFENFIRTYRQNKGLSEQHKKDLWAAFNAGIMCGWKTYPCNKEVNNENLQTNDGSR